MNCTKFDSGILHLSFHNIQILSSLTNIVLLLIKKYLQSLWFWVSVCLNGAAEGLKITLPIERPKKWKSESFNLRNVESRMIIIFWPLFVYHKPNYWKPNYVFKYKYTIYRIWCTLSLNWLWYSSRSIQEILERMEAAMPMAVTVSQVPSETFVCSSCTNRK